MFILITLEFYLYLSTIFIISDITFFIRHILFLQILDMVMLLIMFNIREIQICQTVG